jgi:hypothetical protein
MIEADPDPAADNARSQQFFGAFLSGAHDLAESLQALGEKARRLAVAVCVVAGARSVVVAKG